MMTTLIWAVIGILVVLLIGGILAWIVRSAPFIPDPMKNAVVWAIWAVIALVFLLWLVSVIQAHGHVPGIPT